MADVDEGIADVKENGGEEVKENGVVEGTESKENDGKGVAAVEVVKKPPPEPVKRIPAPDQKELDEKIQEQRALIKAAQEKLTILKAANEKLKMAKTAGKVELSETAKVKNELMTSMRARFEAKKKITELIKALRQEDSDASSSAPMKDLPRQLKGMKTVEQVEMRIKELEYRHNTDSLDLKEEKAIVSEIDFLRHDGLELMAKLEVAETNAKASKEERRKKRDELEGLRKVEDVEINRLQKLLDEQKKIYDTTRASQTSVFDSIKAETADLSYEEEVKVINTGYEEIKKLRADFDKRYKEYRETEKRYKEWERYKKNLKLEKIRAEKEAKRMEREKEMQEYAPPDPYDEEKSMCSSLLTYLQQLDPSTSVGAVAEEPPAASEAAPKAVGREIGGAGKAIGKKVGDGNMEEGMYTAFAKGKKSKRGGASKGTVETDTKDKKLQRHSIDRFTAFHKLGIKPPTMLSEVSATFMEVKRKQEYYASAPPPKEEVNAEQKPDKQKKKKKAPATNSTDEFEDLPDGVPKPADSAVKSSDPSKPSFSDIIQGRAFPVLQHADPVLPSQEVHEAPQSTEPFESSETTAEEAVDVKEKISNVDTGDEQHFLGSDLNEAISSSPAADAAT